jgi:hypothetical protein
MKILFKDMYTVVEVVEIFHSHGDHTVYAMCRKCGGPTDLEFMCRLQDLKPTGPVSWIYKRIAKWLLVPHALRLWKAYERRAANDYAKITPPGK